MSKLRDVIGRMDPAPFKLMVNGGRLEIWDAEKNCIAYTNDCDGLGFVLLRNIATELADVVDAARYMTCQDHSAPIKNCCYCKVDKALAALDAKLGAP